MPSVLLNLLVLLDKITILKNLLMIIFLMVRLLSK